MQEVDLSATRWSPRDKLQMHNRLVIHGHTEMVSEARIFHLDTEIIQFNAPDPGTVVFHFHPPVNRSQFDDYFGKPGEYTWLHERIKWQSARARYIGSLSMPCAKLSKLAVAIKH
jgi:hypothetical protein